MGRDATATGPLCSAKPRTLTYRQLDARANRYARWALARGLGKGDAVALMMPNRPEYMAIWFGLTRAGVGDALINTNLAGAIARPFARHRRGQGGDRRGALSCRSSPRARANARRAVAVFVHGEAASGEPRVDLEVEDLPARR